MFNINGFNQTPNVFQILGIILYLILLVFYSVFVMQLIDGTSFIASMVFFYPFGILTIYYWGVSTGSNPTDRLIIQQIKARVTNEHLNTSTYEYYCNICEFHVSDNAKHCRKCNRCVADFDHHCIWINNCVGNVNYQYFFKLMVYVGISVMSSSIINIKLIFDYHSDAQEVFRRQRLSLFNPNTIHQLFIFNYIQLTINIILLFFDLNLIAFHIWLRKSKITTYQFIINKRHQKQMNYEKKNQYRNQNTIESIKLYKQKQKQNNPDNTPTKVDSKYSKLPFIQYLKQKLFGKNSKVQSSYQFQQTNEFGEIFKKSNHGIVSSQNSENIPDQFQSNSRKGMNSHDFNNEKLIFIQSQNQVNQ